MSVSAAGVAPSTAAASQGRYVWLIYALVSLYAFCYQLQLPLEPFLVDSLVGKGAGSTVTYGRLQSFFQVVQTVGSLAFGSLLDRYGVRVGLLVNFLACALTYSVLANTTSVAMLYLSKVPGVAVAGFLCAQTAVSQLTPDGAERVAALGRLTTAYTIGGVIGPYSGGLLGAKGDYFLSAKIAVVGSLVAAGLCLFLPGNVGRIEFRREEAAADAGRGRRAGWLQRATAILGLVGPLILAKLVTSTANSMASSSQSLILKNELMFTEADLGFFMSCQFAFGGFANGVLLAPVTRLMGGRARSVVSKCVAVMAAGYFFQAALRSSAVSFVELLPGPLQTYLFVGMAMCLSVFQYSLSTSITAENTRIVPKDMKGTLIGMEHGIFSAARIMTPSIGITILSTAGSGAVYATCGCVFLAVFAGWAALPARFLPPSSPQEKAAGKKRG